MNIESLIKNEANKFNGEIGIGFKDLESGIEIFYKGDQKFYMASTFKIYVLIAFYNLVSKNIISLTDKYIVKKEKMLPGSVVDLLTHQKEYFIEDLATLMMIFSDNTATDIICEIVTFEHIKEIIKKLELENTVITKNCNEILTGFFNILSTDTEEEVMKKVEELEFTHLVTDKDNITTPKDIVKTFNYLYNNKVLDEENSNKAIDTMLKCMTNNRIPRYLPIGTKIAHKTGTLHGIVNDAGIVFTPKGNYILAFYTNSEPKDKIMVNIQAEDFLAKLSRKIYDEYVK